MNENNHVTSVPDVWKSHAMHQCCSRPRTAIRKCTARNNLTSRQQREGVRCHSLRPKRPRSEQLRCQQIRSSIRLMTFRAKASILPTVFLLLLVLSDCAYLPSDKVGHRIQSEDTSDLSSLRVLQQQPADEVWTSQNERDVTPAPVATIRPTLQPMMQTTIKSSSDSPAPYPASAPAIGPTIFSNETQTIYPSNAPSDNPSVIFSDSPSHNPSFKPSWSPVVAASREPTYMPSSTPSGEAKRLRPSRFPLDRSKQGPESNEEEQTEGNFTSVALPIRFKARLEGVRESDIDELLPRVATIWRSFFKDSLEQRFGKASFVFIELVVTAEQERRGLRTLQTDNVVDVLDIYARGQINMQFDNEEADTKKEELLSFLDGAITRDNLQNALTSSNSNFEVSVEGKNDDEPINDDRPKLWEIVLGFFILAVALSTIVFWIVILGRKRKMRIRKKKLAAMRNTAMDAQSDRMMSPGVQSSTYSAHSTLSSRPTTPMVTVPVSEGPRQATPAPFAKSKVFIVRADTKRDDDDDSAYKGLRSDDSDTGSEFGRQLREAASFDKASWEEFQRQKRDLEAASRLGTSYYGSENSSITEIRGEHEEQGIEVEHGDGHAMIFPYGDEKRSIAIKSEKVKYSPFSSGYDSATSAANSADRFGTQDHGDFEPYGDSKDIPSVGFLSRKTFAYGRQDIAEPASSDEPSDSVLRTSPTASSWSGEDLTDMDEPVGTLSMLQEVEQLSQYVQQYERKKESRKMRDLELKQREFDNTQRNHVSMSIDSHERQDLDSGDSNLVSPHHQRNYSENIGGTSLESRSLLSHRRGSNTRGSQDEGGVDDPGIPSLSAYEIPQRSILPASFDSLHSSTEMSEGEDEISHHLGIRHQYPLVSGNNSNIDNTRDYTGNRGRPIQVENSRQDVPGNIDRQNSPASLYQNASILFVNPHKAATPDSKPSTRNSRIPVSRDETRLSGILFQEKASTHPVDGAHLNPSSIPQKSPSPSRNADGKIGNIVTMFENKPHTVVMPPSPSWQYEN